MPSGVSGFHLLLHQKSHEHPRKKERRDMDPPKPRDCAFILFQHGLAPPVERKRLYKPSIAGGMRGDT
jgi:hypothetical protein